MQPQQIPRKNVDPTKEDHVEIMEEKGPLKGYPTICVERKDIKCISI